MFCQHLNARTGEVEWVHVLADADEVEVEGDNDNAVDEMKLGTDGNRDQSEGLVESLNAHSTYIEMLNDMGRNEAYRGAIESVLRPGDRILDIGTGTGLLALLAAKSEAGENEETSITACELYPPMVRLSKSIIRQNGLDHKIQVIGKRSDELTTKDGKPLEPFDVIVTEIFDSELLGEGLLPTLRHAVHHLLAKHEGDGDGKRRIIPARASVFVQLVNWPEVAVGIGSGRVELETAFLEGMSPVSSPKEAFAFSLLDPPEDHAKGPAIQLHAISNSGNNKDADAADGLVSCHGVLLWWQLTMDGTGCNYLSTAPRWIASIEEGGDRRKDRWVGHWKQVFLPWEKPMHLKVGEKVTLQAQVGDTHFKINKVSTAGESRDPDCCGDMLDVNQSESFQSKYLQESLNRTLFVKSEAARRTYARAIERSLECLLNPTDWTVAVTGNSLWLVEMLLLEFCIPGLVWVCDDQEHIYFKKLVAKRRLGSRVKVLPLDQMDHQSLLSGGTQQCFLVAEPYFQFLDGHLPWSHWLHFAYIRQRINDICGEGEVSSIPSQAKLKGAAADFPYLWQGRKPVTSIAGIDLHLHQGMSAAKQSGTSKGSIKEEEEEGSACEICSFDMFQSFHLSSYEGNHRLLSEARVLSQTDLVVDSDNNNNDNERSESSETEGQAQSEEKLELKITQSGKVNCFLIWVEATLLDAGKDSELNNNVTLQTGPGTGPNNHSLWHTAAALVKKQHDDGGGDGIGLTAGQILTLRTQISQDYATLRVSLQEALDPFSPTGSNT